ncbi:MAG TPA: rhomboid family intramembrane serine protease [Virgibacillus sp.]|nr:rhomboid family intramembrane serine protease [Virgibacillus sp.]
MPFYEQLTLFQTAYDFMKNNQYHLMYMKDDGKEIWLEKTEKNKSNVIRLQQGGFDWKNHLKRDIAQVFQITKNMKKILRSKEIMIYNIYISDYEPVDEWEQLKKPLKLEEKHHPIKMQIYYLTNKTKESELHRLQQDLTLMPFTKNTITSDDEADEELAFYQQSFNEFVQSAKKTNNVFSYGKPFFTYILIVINILMYTFLEVFGGSTDTDTLIKFGANYNLSIVSDNEWWRIVASMFLHIGLVHLVMNMIALYYLGSIVERIYGSGRFLIIYFLAGIGGGLASFLFPINVSAGASGAIFGLFGALLFFGANYKDIFFRTMGRGVVLIIGINIIFGFSTPDIDMAAHIGGLVTGFIVSAIVFVPHKEHKIFQAGATVLYVLLVIAMIIIGTEQTKSSGNLYIAEIIDLIEEEKYQEAIDLATTGLDNTSDTEEQLRFQRSYANILLDNTEEAKEDLRKIIELDTSFPEAYHNLALLYYNEGNIDKAEKAIQKAVDLDDSETNQSLYRLIFGEETSSKKMDKPVLT